MALTLELETDPVATRELGGPRPREKIEAAHRRRMGATTKGECWWFTIVPDPETGPVGTIGVWEHEDEGRPVVEAGWMLLPRHHGKGYARRALAMLIRRLRADGRFDEIQALSGVNNLASNALCRGAGFVLERVRELAGGWGSLRVNHWTLKL